MIRALARLGVRLALGSARAQRFRAGVALGTGMLAAFVVLHTLAASEAAAELNRTPTLGLFAFNSLQWIVIVAVTLPVAGLVATVCRMSATLRDQRLARLQVLGLSPGQTRLVAAVETVSPLAIGTVVGAGLFLATQTLAASLWFALVEFPPPAYRPGGWGWLAAMLALPVLALIVAVAPVRASSARALTGARHPARRPRCIWRLAVLAVGAAGVISVSTRSRQGAIAKSDVWLYPVSAVLTVVGVFVVVPVLSALVAAVMLRLGRAPSVRIAARRLQYQPAAATRIIASVLVALFMLSMVRPLVGGYNQDPVYLADHLAATTGPQILQVSLPEGVDVPAARRILREQGVTKISFGTYLRTREGCLSETDRKTCTRAQVTSCWGLAAMDLVVPGCRDGQAAWLSDRRPDAGPVQLIVDSDQQGAITISVPTRRAPATRNPNNLPADIPELFIPFDAPGVQEFLAHRPVSLVVEGPGGIGVEATLKAALEAEIDDVFVTTTRAFANYVQTRNIVLVLNVATLAVLLLGLLSFALASIDQVLARRVSLTSLLVLGVPTRTLRTAQIWETLVPLGLGLPLAIGLGWFTGSGAHVMADQPTVWSPVLGLASVALVGVVATTCLLVVAGIPRIQSQNIRRP